MDFKNELNKKAQFVNSTLKKLLKQHKDIYKDLRKALAYTLEAPGKRIRSALVLWSCEATSGKVKKEAQIAAAAVEMVHTYSLIHDDLPAMDNDDFRRGLPTCHKAFDEATAILAGDALLTLAFEILAKEITDAAISIKLIGELAEAAGPAGMVAGQMADLKAERIKGTEKLLKYIHTNKTAKMFRGAAAMGAIAGRASKKQYKVLCDYGLKIGLGFQIADDILDESATSEHLGKTAGKDKKASKCTYPAIFGLKKSKQIERMLANEAVALLKSFGPKADILRQLPLALLARTR
jgi:geranylgeranyl diphosphate synthase type II